TAVGRSRGVRHGSTRIRACGLAQGVGRLSPAAGAEAASHRARTSGRRARGEAGRMPNGDEPLKRRAIILRLVLLIAAASGAAAQQPVISPPPSEHGEFFARTDFHLNAAWLGLMSNRTSGPTPDQRFDWDTFWGGSLDLVDYVKGRVG